MESKESVSKGYMEYQKQHHAGKQLRPARERLALILGAEPGNIGAAIKHRLECLNFLTIASNKAYANIAINQSIFKIRKFDTVVFCNGSNHLDWIEHQPPSKIAEVIEDCLTASIQGAASFVEATIDMPHRKQIIFIGSMAYRNVLNGSAPYCAAKAGLAHFAKCLAWELAPKGYDVFCIHPSNTEGTPMTEATIKGLMDYRGLNREEAEAYWGACLPRDKWLQPTDIAGVVEFLVSGKAGYLSGANLDLGGGQR